MNEGRFKPAHGMSRTPTHESWRSMKQRCNNPRSTAYRNYGGRGITVCERWNSFENFLADMGEQPDGMQIERIHNDLGYAPGNCRWATRKEQHRNKRSNRMITFKSETLPLAAWAERLNIRRDTLSRRLKKASIDIVFTKLAEGL